MRSGLDEIETLLATFRPISLDEMASVRLMNRTDTKYVIRLDSLPSLLAQAQGDYMAQETDGRRLMDYKTTYYDTTDWQTLRAHTTGRHTREKIRVRRYATGLTFIEVKRKSKGRTKKSRMATSSRPGGQMTAEAKTFVDSHSRYPSASLSPALGNTFRRITLVNNAKTERLTIDLGIAVENLRNGVCASLPDAVVVEVKRDGRKPSHMMEWLHAKGLRPCGFSKFAYGALLTDCSLPIGKMKPKMRRLIRQSLMPEPLWWRTRWNAA